MVDTLHPIYVPSKGRADGSSTADLLTAEDVPYTFVVEADDAASYAAAYPQAAVLTLPESNMGLSYSRNWIKQHSKELGQKRHWQVDDDVKQLFQFRGGERVPVAAAPTLDSLSAWADRYTNLHAASLMHNAFGFRIPGPFSLNQGVYTIVLIENDTPYLWRDDTIEDFDYSLQVLAAGNCTVLWHLYQFASAPTGSNSGGVEWGAADRLRRAKRLSADWPGMVRVRPPSKGKTAAFSVAHVWRKFDQPLIHA